MHPCSCGMHPATRSAARSARSLGVRAALRTDPRTGLQMGCSRMWPTAGTWCDPAPTRVLHLSLLLHVPSCHRPSGSCIRLQVVQSIRFFFHQREQHRRCELTAVLMPRACAQVCDFRAYSGTSLYLINKPNQVFGINHMHTINSNEGREAPCCKSNPWTVLLTVSEPPQTRPSPPARRPTSATAT